MCLPRGESIIAVPKKCQHENDDGDEMRNLEHFISHGSVMLRQRERLEKCSGEESHSLTELNYETRKLARPER